MLSVEGRHPHPSARAHSHNRLEGHFPCEGPREVIPTYIIYIYIYTHYTYTCVCVCVCVYTHTLCVNTIAYRRRARRGTQGSATSCQKKKIKYRSVSASRAA